MVSFREHVGFEKIQLMNALLVRRHAGASEASTLDTDVRDDDPKNTDGTGSGSIDTRAEPRIYQCMCG